MKAKTAKPPPEKIFLGLKSFTVEVIKA